MPKLYFVIEFEEGPLLPQEKKVLAYVDLNQDKKSQPPERFKLKQQGRKWSGTIEFKKPSNTDGLVITSAVFDATLGAKYRIAAYQNDSDGNLIAEGKNLTVVDSEMDHRFLYL